MSTSRQAALVAVVILTLLTPIGACADEPATFVGAPSCAACHTVQFDAWKGSHHALAMQKAAEATVLGDFAHAKLERSGVTTSFFRDGDKVAKLPDEHATHSRRSGQTSAGILAGK